MNSRDIDVLKHITRFCNEIKEARERFGDSLDSLKADVHYKNAVAMGIMQIGELTTRLTDDFKLEYNGMPWQDIKGMRNIAAHHYGKLDVQKLWETISSDIPDLHTYCEETLQSVGVTEIGEEN